MTKFFFNITFICHFLQGLFPCVLVTHFVCPFNVAKQALSQKFSPTLPARLENIFLFLRVCELKGETSCNYLTLSIFEFVSKTREHVQWKPLKVNTFKGNSNLQLTLFGSPILHCFIFLQWLKLFKFN